MGFILVVDESTPPPIGDPPRTMPCFSIRPRSPSAIHTLRSLETIYFPRNAEKAPGSPRTDRPPATIRERVCVPFRPAGVFQACAFRPPLPPVFMHRFAEPITLAPKVYNVFRPIRLLTSSPTDQVRSRQARGELFVRLGGLFDISFSPDAKDFFLARAMHR